MKTKPTTYTTENEGNGFHGAMESSPMIKRELARLYDLAARTLVAEGIATDGDEAIAFLDSRMGRHLADRMDSAESDTEIRDAIRQHGAGHMKQYRRALAEG